jgi:hypothetical protein
MPPLLNPLLSQLLQSLTPVGDTLRSYQLLCSVMAARSNQRALPTLLLTQQDLQKQRLC